jgi:hypothetical protein
MKGLGSVLRAMVAATIALSLWAAPAAAQNAIAGGTNTLSAALAMPFDVGDPLPAMRITQATVVNRAPFAAVGLVNSLHVLFISPDFNARQVACPINFNQTVDFVFARNPSTGTPEVSYSCWNPSTSTVVPQPALALPSSQGIMYVSYEDRVGPPLLPGGRARLVAAIYGDATVIDFMQGFAYSFDAINFQGAALPTAVGNPPFFNNRNRQFLFNGGPGAGLEYSAFPANLSTNYVLPTAPFGTPGVSASLVLFTLDGTIGSSPNARIFTTFFTSTGGLGVAGPAIIMDEAYQVEDLAPLFTPPAPAPVTAQINLAPTAVVRSDPLHDAAPPLGLGNGDGIRTTPVHGWVVQAVPMGSTVPGIPGSPTLFGNVAWARALDTSSMPLPLGAGDLAYGLQAPCLPSGTPGFPCSP